MEKIKTLAEFHQAVGELAGKKMYYAQAMIWGNDVDNNKIKYHSCIYGKENISAESDSPETTILLLKARLAANTPTPNIEI